MRRRLLIFIGCILAALLLAAGAFVGLVTTVGRGYCTEPYVPNLLTYKLERLRRSTSPRFVILSGSNAQNSIDCDDLARRIGMDVVCCGVIFRMPVRFYRALVEDVLEPGDVLYLPLEPSVYEATADELTTPFSVSLLWGVCPQALMTLSVQELFPLYARKGLGWLQLVCPKLVPKRTFSAAKPSGVYDFVMSEPGSRRVGFIKPRGDLANNSPAEFDSEELVGTPTRFSDEFARSFGELVRMAQGKGVRVLLGLPPCYAYPRETDRPKFAARQQELSVPVCGDPAALCLPYGCFSDYSLHCNAAGRRLFTYEISREICRALGKPFEETPGWPLVAFPGGTNASVRFAQSAACAGRKTFADILVDRGGAPAEKVVDRVLVDGRAVTFEEHVFAAKNVLWVNWESASCEVSLDIVSCADKPSVRIERVLMEPDESVQVASVSTFNDVSSGFRPDPKDPLRFVSKGTNAADEWLRIRLPDWKSNRWRLHLDIACGNSARMALVVGHKYERAVRPDELTGNGLKISVMLNESDAFVDENGTGCVGLRFPSGTLDTGETFVVRACRFERL